MRKRISKYKHLHSNRFRYLSSSIPLICASGLLLVTGLMINPLGVSDQTFAASIGEATNPGGGDDTVDETSVELTVTQPTLTKPSMAGVVNYISTGLSVTAKKVDTYNIVVQATEDATGSLVGETTGAEIRGVGSNVATSAFTDDSWGYALAEGSVETAGLENLAYNTVPENGQGATTPAYSQKVKDEAVAGKDFTLAFAAKFGNNTKADHYRSNVLVSVAVNPEGVVQTLSDVEFMQDLTPEICRNSSENETKQLDDSRDRKSYWVAKLKDGNCWMVQNLDLDLVGKILSPDDSDVTQDWTGGQEVASSLWDTSTDDIIGWYDPGAKVVSGESLVDAGSTDSHLLVGNYYSWAAATAGSGVGLEEDGQVAEDSICPKNWKLPLSGDSLGSLNLTNGSYYNLLNQYGLSEVPDNGSYSLFDNPFYVPLAGVIGSDGLVVVGKQVVYQSSVAGLYKHLAYLLMITSTNVTPSHINAGKAAGRSVRCVMLSAGVENPVTYKVQYNTNGGNAVPDQTHTNTTSSQSFVMDLSKSAVPIRANYSFRGWSDVVNGAVKYEPGDKITLTSDNSSITLYAVWEPVVNKLTSISTLQALTSSICTQTTTPSKWDTVSGVPTTQLRDTRDNKVYWVAKLADGNCWMTQNLDYDGGGTRITSTDGLFGGPGTEWKDDNSVAQYWDPGEKVATWDPTNQGALVNPTSSDNHLLVGNYYSYDAAMQVCPSGWVLPIQSDTGNNGSFEKLRTVYNIKNNAVSTDITQAPFYFTYSAWVTSGQLIGAGTVGDYRISTKNSEGKIYYMYFGTGNTNNLQVTTEDRYYFGKSVRCLVLGS